MTEGDRILIETVRRLHGEAFDDDGTSGCSEKPLVVAERLSDFSSDQILDVCMRCVNAVFRSSCKTPPFPKRLIDGGRMSARYRLADQLARACLELGYLDKSLGYQSFLYGNEEDIRNILSFLLDLVPKDGATKATISEGSKGADEENTERVIKEERLTSKADSVRLVSGSSALEQNSASKRHDERVCDDFCTCASCLDQETKSADIFRILPKETRGSFLGAVEASSATRSHHLVQSVNEAAPIPEDSQEDLQENPNLSSLGIVNLRTEASLDMDESIKSALLCGVVHELSDEEEFVKILPEKKMVVSSSLETGDLSKESVDDRSTTPEHPVEDRKHNEENKAAKTMQEAINEGLTLISELETRIEEETRDAEKRRVLMDELEDGPSKLEADVEKYRSRLSTMRDRWNSHKSRLEAKRDSILHQIEEKRKDAVSSMIAEENLRMEIERVRSDIERKEWLETKYRKDLTKASEDYVPRSTYTKHILAILKSLALQREETSKVIEDIKRTQYDINLLEGKRSRTYWDVDNSLFELARRNSLWTPSYKMLTEIHSKSGIIVDAIRRIGVVKRLTRTINDQVETERRKNVAQSVKKLTKDLEIFKLENKELKERLELKNTKMEKRSL